MLHREPTWPQTDGKQPEMMENDNKETQTDAHLSKKTQQNHIGTNTVGVKHHKETKKDHKCC